MLPRPHTAKREAQSWGARSAITNARRGAHNGALKLHFRSPVRVATAVSALDSAYTGKFVINAVALRLTMRGGVSRGCPQHSVPPLKPNPSWPGVPSAGTGHNPVSLQNVHRGLQGVATETTGKCSAPSPSGRTCEGHGSDFAVSTDRQGDRWARGCRALYKGTACVETRRKEVRGLAGAQLTTAGHQWRKCTPPTRVRVGSLRDSPRLAPPVPLPPNAEVSNWGHWEAVWHSCRRGCARRWGRWRCCA